MRMLAAWPAANMRGRPRFSRAWFFGMNARSSEQELVVDQSHSGVKAAAGSKAKSSRVGWWSPKHRK
jgi:hypothetical protein